MLSTDIVCDLCDSRVPLNQQTTAIGLIPDDRFKGLPGLRIIRHGDCGYETAKRHVCMNCVRLITNDIKE